MNLSTRHLLLVTLALGMAGCTRQAAPAGSRVVVNYWEKWSGFEADSMRTVVDDFNRSQNRIEVRFLSIAGVDTKLLLATSSGHPPDMAGLWSENIPDFSEKGALTPLDGGLAGPGSRRTATSRFSGTSAATGGSRGGFPRRPVAWRSSITRSFSERQALTQGAPRARSPSLRA